MLLDIESVYDEGRYRIKDREKAGVFACVCRMGVTTRKRLVQILKLRPTTVSDTLKQLIEDNLVVEKKLINTGRQGRPEISLCPNYDRICAIALVAVSKKIRGVLINLGEQILADKSRELDTEINNRQLQARLLDLINELVESKPQGSTIIGIGVSLPGDADGDNRRWLFNARWRNIRNFSFDGLAQSSGLPIRIFRMLDAELEYRLLLNPKYAEGGTLLFHWGFGIGAAYANQGKVIRSTLGSFIEIGHIRLHENEKKTCTCGDIGCVETEAALWSLIQEIREIYPTAPEDESMFSEYFLNVSTDQVATIVDKAKSAVVDSLNFLYRVFYPDRILIYGPFTENPGVVSELKNQFYERIPSFARKKTRVIAFNNENSLGEIIGSTIELFRNSMQSHLIVR